MIYFVHVIDNGNVLLKHLTKEKAMNKSTNNTTATATTLAAIAPTESRVDVANKIAELAISQQKHLLGVNQCREALLPLIKSLKGYKFSAQRKNSKTGVINDPVACTFHDTCITRGLSVSAANDYLTAFKKAVAEQKVPSDWNSSRANAKAKANAGKTSKAPTRKTDRQKFETALKGMLKHPDFKKEISSVIGAEQTEELLAYLSELVSK